jgi:hypothetical protein
MTVGDFLLNMDKLNGNVVAVHGEVFCDNADLCVLYEAEKINIAFDTSGLPQETRRRLQTCGNPYRCRLLVTGLAQASQNFGALLIAREVEWPISPTR